MGGFAHCTIGTRFGLLPWIGTKVAHDKTGVYEYLPASIRTSRIRNDLKQVLRDAGLPAVSRITI